MHTDTLPRYITLSCLQNLSFAQKINNKIKKSSPFSKFSSSAVRLERKDRSTVDPESPVCVCVCVCLRMRRASDRGEHVCVSACADMRERNKQMDSRVPDLSVIV